MDDTIKLVNEWAAYREHHCDGTIEEFCRYYLIRKREELDIGKNFGGLIPPQTNAYLIKLIGRIFQCCLVYTKAILPLIPQIRQFEDFTFLNSVRYMNGKRKTDIINYNLSELSSGIDIMNRLRDSGLIEEKQDEKDRRARIISITAEGEKVLFACYEKLLMVNEMLFVNLNDEDKKLCIQLLKSVEIKNSELAMELKGKSFAEMIFRVLGVREKDSGVVNGKNLN